MIIIENEGGMITEERRREECRKLEENKRKNENDATLFIYSFTLNSTFIPSSTSSIKSSIIVK
jgi:hypothetical protein